MELGKRILLEILKRGEVKRRDILQEFSVAKSTVSYVINKLKESRLISIDHEKNGRGRPSEIIAFSENYWKVAGMKVGREAVIGIRMDGRLRELEKFEERVPYELRNVEGYKRLIRRVFEKINGKNLKALGVSVSGIVDKKGRVSSEILNLNDFDVKAFLNEFAPGLHIDVMSDVEALGVHENIKYGTEEFLLINYGIGIGACTYDKDNISVIPIGHLVVVPNGEECYCGQKGCLETVASDYANLKRYMKKNFSIKEFVAYEHEKYEMYLNELWGKLKFNPDRVSETYKDSIRWLGVIVGNLVKIFKTKKVVFYGEGVSDWFVNEIKKEVKRIFKMEDIVFLCRKELDSFEKGAAYRAMIKVIKEGIQL